MVTVRSVLTSARDVSGDTPEQVLLQQPLVLDTGARIDLRKRCRLAMPIRAIRLSA